MKKTKSNKNTGELKVLNFNIKVFDLKEKLIKEKTESLLNGSINESNKSSFINSELHKKITNIKKNGAHIFKVRRYSGEPTMNPREITRE